MLELFELIDKTIQILTNNQIASTFVVTFEERENIHFHACILPRHNWMQQITNHIADNFTQIIDYAKQTFISQQDYEEIKHASDIVGINLKQIVT